MIIPIEVYFEAVRRDPIKGVPVDFPKLIPKKVLKSLPDPKAYVLKHAPERRWTAISHLNCLWIFGITDDKQWRLCSVSLDKQYPY